MDRNALHINSGVKKNEGKANLSCGEVATLPGLSGNTVTPSRLREAARLVLLGHHRPG